MTVEDCRGFFANQDLWAVVALLLFRGHMNRKNQKEITTTLYIKNMVCNRCIRVVREELEKLGLRIRRIELGEVDIAGRKVINTSRVRDVLLRNGFELIEDSARELGRDYHYLSSLFSSVENVTIEQYVILQRIERVKELVKYGEMTLSEIAYKTGYRSVQHLSNQFRKVTGMTPTVFKELKKGVRKPIDKVGVV
jgi:AraC family transcriptional regulator